MRKMLFFASILTLMIGQGVQAQKYTDKVNPFLGTETLWDENELGFKPTRRTWGAEVYPGSSLPNAMVQLSPVTMFRAGAGYQWEDSTIFGFSHTNKGHWNLNYIPILPITGEVFIDDYDSKFSHDNESARPAYYQVFLDRYGVNVELTSTLRCAYHKYSYKKGATKRVLINLPRSNESVREWKINQDGSNTFSGYQRTGETMYFYAVSNYHIESIDSISKVIGKQVAINKDAAGGARRRDFKEPIPVVNFKQSAKNEPLELKIGFSFVSVEAARKNLEIEMLDKSFEQVKLEGDKVWNDLLSKIDVTGGTEKQQRLFYSTFYRSMLWPVLRSDADGTFVNAKNEVTNKGFQFYTDPSFWDDYRNKLILLGMVNPVVAQDVISSCIDRGMINGFMPTFFHGDHASTFVTGSYLRGIRNFDVNAAYKLMLHNAKHENPARPFLNEYIEKGYVCEVDLSKLPRIEIHTDAKAAVTKTQEYSYDDYAVALLAKELGDIANYDTLMERSVNYRNLYDSSARFFRGKLENGEWVKNFDPCFPYYHYQFREATGWMSAFFAPHDTSGLIELYGGNEMFETKLDSLFSIPWQGYEAHNLSGFIGQYCHGNQPDHTFPFLYYFIGKPEKSQLIIDRLLNDYYSMGPNNLAYAGMDDAGEMSSWFVLASIGLYTYSPADPEYLLTVPLFDKIQFTLPDAQFNIIKKGEGRKFIGATYDKQPIKGLFITHRDLQKGKELIINTTNE